MLNNKYFIEATELVNNYILTNNINLNTSIGFEVGLKYFEIICKVKRRGCSFVRKGSNIYLQFVDPSTKKQRQFSCNEYISKDGCLNALAKALAVVEHLNKFDKVSEFWSWYDENIRQIKTVENDIITVGQAIEKVKENYLKGDHNGISRSHPEFLTNSLGNFDRQYGLTYNKMLELNLGDKPLNAELLIEFLESNYSELQTKKMKGFKQEIEKLKEENLFLKKRITELEIELNGGEGITKLF